MLSLSIYPRVQLHNVTLRDCRQNITTFTTFCVIIDAAKSTVNSLLLQIKAEAQSLLVHEKQIFEIITINNLNKSSN